METRSYSRVSTKSQANTGHSIDIQPEQIVAYCTLKNLPLPIQYSDGGVSGKETRNRKDFLRMLQEVENGDHVIITSISRFARNTIETLQIVKDFTKRNITLHSIYENIDMSTPSGKFFFTLLAALAELESNQTGQRIKSVHQHRKSQKKTYAKLITGYKNVYDFTQDGKRTNGRLVPDENMNTVKTIFQLKQTGKGAYSIASILNKQGVKPPQGTKFYQSSILSILKNPIYQENDN